MAWYESTGGGSNAGLNATEVIVLTAEYTSEPLPVEQENS